MKTEHGTTPMNTHDETQIIRINSQQDGQRGVPGGNPNRRLSLREQMFVDRLPEFNWNIEATGMAVGWKPSYVKTVLHHRVNHSLRLRKAITDKRVEIQERTWSIESWRKLMTEALERCKARGDRTNEKELLRMIGQHIGAFEADNRQRQVNFGMLIM
jgi:hypothetical protein